ncbi:MAG: endonuclease/exonuclease/phosphatase family protein [Planctomycetota bacterium]
MTAAPPESLKPTGEGQVSVRPEVGAAEVAKTRRSVLVTVVVWVIAVAASGPLVLPALVPTPDEYFVTALLLALTAQAVIGVLVGALASSVARRWAAALVCVSAAMLGLGRVAGVPRAEAAPAGSSAERVVRVLTMNVRPQNSIGPEMGAILREFDPDVAFFVEPNWETVELLRADSSVRERWPHAHVPDRAGPGFAVILSKHEQWAGWPRRPNPGRALVGGRLRLAEIRGAFGTFVFGGTFPESPKSPERWARGQERLRDAIEKVRAFAAKVEEEDGAPPVIVIAGDMNDTPTGARRRMLERALDLVETKPLWGGAGTWPSALPWPMSVSIDAVLVSRGVRVREWRTVPIPGSDHHGVYVELVLPEPGGE